MFIPDLQRLEPSRWAVRVYRDGEPIAGVLPPGDIVQAVGWLEDVVPIYGSGSAVMVMLRSQISVRR